MRTLIFVTTLLLAFTIAGSAGLPEYIYITQPSGYLLATDYEDAQIKAEFPFGTRFKVLGKSEEWYKVTIDNMNGYMSEYTAQSYTSMSPSQRARLQKALKNDTPMVELSPGTTVLRRDTIHLYALIGDGLGEVTTREWKIGSAPFVPTLRSDTTIIAPSVADSAFLVILKATDNTGMSTSDTARFNVVQTISEKLAIENKAKQ